MSEWWAAFWFFLPAGIANASPLLAAHLPLLNKWNAPIDGGRKFRGKRILGDNKTWRGLAFGAFTGATIGLLQYRVITSSAESTGFIILVTAALGFGAMFGDSVESFLKRQVGIPSGDKWFPFDQIDYIIGGLLFASLFVPSSLADMLRIIVLYFGLHVVIVYLGYKLGIRSKPI